MDSYEREVVGPFLPHLPGYAVRQVVDAIEVNRERVADTLLLADTVTRAAVRAVTEAATVQRDAGAAERHVSRALSTAVSDLLGESLE